MLKIYSLKLLKENGNIPIPSDVFTLCRGGRLAGVVVCPLRRDRFSPGFFWKPIFLVISSTSFISTVQGPAVQWAASMAWKDGAKVVAHKSRMEDPPLPLPPLPLQFLQSQWRGHFASLLPADVKTGK